MPAPLGSRTCPVLGCSRRVHVTAGGTVFARCLDHTLPQLRGFAPVTPDPSDEGRASLPTLGRASRLSDRTSLAVGARSG